MSNKKDGEVEMLIGEYSHSIDAKGRIFIPAKFREELGDNFIITRGTEECLFVFSENAWRDFASKLQHLPVTDIEAQKFLRLQFASAIDCTPDKQGRVLVSANLREHAKFDKEVVAIGVMSRVELWSKENWEKYKTYGSEEYQNSLRKLSELGI